MEPVQRDEPASSARDTSGRQGKQASPRRVFLSPREIPGLLAGVLRGDATAQRRVLGARKGGRFGVVLGLAALVLVSPGWLAGAALAALHVALTLGVGFASGRSPVRAHQRLRLSLWAGTPPLLLAAPLRLAWPESVLPALLGLIAAQLILDRSLRRAF